MANFRRTLLGIRRILNSTATHGQFTVPLSPIRSESLPRPCVGSFTRFCSANHSRDIDVSNEESKILNSTATHGQFTVPLSRIRSESLPRPCVGSFTRFCSANHSRDIDVSNEESKRRLFNRLLYRSGQRGFLELDMVLGKWVEEHIHSLDENGIKSLVDVLDQENPDLWKWLTEQEQPPEAINTNPVRNEHCSALFSSVNHIKLSHQLPRSSFPSVLRYSSTPKEPSKISEKRNIQDHKRRLLAAKFELKRNLYKALCQDPGLPTELREKHRYNLSKLPRNSSFSRVRNRCIFTGRSRAVYELFRMSRIVFRGLASQGSLMGVKKASW